MKRTAVVFLVVVAALGVASCGGSDDDKGSGTQASAPSKTNAPTDDLTACLIDAGFSEPTNFVATVEVDGVENIATVAFPPPHTEDNFLVVYEAPDEGSAAKAAKGFAGGPFIEQVGSRLYTVAGANDPLSATQTKAVEDCLGS